ncbi:MAG: SAM-dependent methyltransferase [Patescibacteria group bacterium]|jgi:SAM-dependent methyltransferase
MQIFLSFAGLVIFLEIIFVIIAFWTAFTIFFTRVPFAPTPKKNFKKIFDELNLRANAEVYDLGCGDGSFLFEAEKLGFQAIGFELSPYPYFLSLIKKFRLNSRVKISRKNFFKENISRADAVFLFLIASIMPRVGLKLKKELKPGTPVVSYGFRIPDWKAIKILDTKPSKTFIYRA